ncbi:phage replisome organizer N-terminal domain-containing protein [Clostridium kluyveri]|uniref:Phage-related protein n=2 Tax=Clostridium kluyveri TaxID=1534 RepID=A5N2F3_CLOK5|nr:phage replisome organizer N-terminal domain-containing protein [Clostridium kluyveri]EDK35299.1 Phage-related protein [Clostridium kluyveri DSM 555]BAH07963.1 hypothetical protein CKR_2912 [Clostridium kluyveri NBRC 12016]
MAEIKWIKITTTMFDDEKIKLIDAMPERDTIFYIWMRLLVQAGKTNAGGYIFLTEDIPYTDEMLSAIFNRPLNTVRLALDTLKKFGMIQRSENNDLKITNWDKHQNVESMDKIREGNRLRKRRQREKEKQQELLEEPKNSEENVTEGEEIVMSQDSHEMSRDSHAIREREREEDLDLDNKRERREKKDLSLDNNALELCKYWEVLKPGENITAHLAALKIFINTYGYDWCKEAMQIMVKNKNKFILSYMEKILKNWLVEGKSEECGTSKKEKNAPKPPSYKVVNQGCCPVCGGKGVVRQNNEWVECPKCRGG